MADIFVDYHARFFTTSNPAELERVLVGVQPVVDDSMNAALSKPFVWEEVEVAIKKMAPLKALGLDGMPPIFYQTFWLDIGMEISDVVLSCLNSSTFLRSINHTFITLIPKVANPETVAQFRPISLWNVIYKLLSKVLVNKLKPTLNSIISEAQSAFIVDRVITDNILIAFETLHHMKTQCSGKTGLMALKLDMSKAYDRVEWVFLEKILLKMGFKKLWVTLIMQCVTTVSYSLLVNGEPQGFICPSKGLREGDPLSPFLFLFCVEGLNALLSIATSEGDIRGYSICRVGPRISHLFFTDDCLLLCRATPAECANIQHILGWYEAASRQQVNFDKTTAFFSRNTFEEIQEELKVMLGMPAIKSYEKYLGLPSFVGRQKKKLALITSRSGFGPVCKGGRRNYSLKPVRKL